MKKNQAPIKTVPNQKVITVHKEKVDKQHLFTANNLEALFEAMYNLVSTVGFKLYMYIAKNRDDFSFALSSSDFCQKANCGMRAYNTAVEELIRKGYLVRVKETETIYNFYEKARPQENSIFMEESENAEINFIEETEVQMTINTKKTIKDFVF